MTRLRARWVLERRPRYFFAVIAILLIGSTLIFVAAFTNALTREVLINVGASAVGVFLTVIVLEPIIEHGRRPEEIIHPQFPHQDFITGVDRCTHRVRIMGAWPYVMDDHYRDDFLHCLAGALRRNVGVQILILDPTSSAAEQRELDLDSQLEVPLIISEALMRLSDFRKSLDLPSGVRPNLEVRIYSSLPPARMYRWDNRAISSFFPMGSGLGTDVRHYETSVTSGLGRFVDEQFDLVWRSPDTQELSEYLVMNVILLPGRTKFETPYVVLDATIFTVSTKLALSIFESNLRDPLVRLETRVNPRTDVAVGQQFTVTSILEHDARVDMIRTMFHRKYGRADPLNSGFQAVIALTPQS